MQDYVVILTLGENSYRRLGSLPSNAGVYTLIVRAESYSGALAELNVQDDCLKVEIYPVTANLTTPFLPEQS